MTIGEAGLILFLDEDKTCGAKDVIEAALLLIGSEDGETGETETNGVTLAIEITGDEWAGNG